MFEAKDRVNVINDRNWTRMRIAFAVFAALALVFAFSCIYKSAKTAEEDTKGVNNPGAIFDDTTYTSLNEGWTLTHENGDKEQIILPVTINVTPGESFMLTRDWDNENIVDPALILYYERYGVQVYADNALIWQVNTTSLASRIMFTDPGFVEIPDGVFTPAELRIRFSGAEDGEYVLYEMTCGTMAMAERDMIKHEISTMIILVVMLFMSISILIAYVLYAIRRFKEPRLLCLTVFLILSFLWGATDSFSAVLTGIPPEVIGTTLYLSLMAMPIPMVVYIWLTCKRRGLVLPALAYYGVINIVIRVILAHFELLRLDNSILASHIYSMVVIVTSLIALVREIRRDRENKSIKIMLAGGASLSFMAALALVLYWMGSAMYYRNSMLIGALVFFVFLMTGTAMDYTRRARNEQKKLQESEINERLSYIDSLTGLRNRRAFEKAVAEIEADTSIDNAMLVMFDVNGLKYTNDNYGHAAGDDLIIAAGEVIGETFESTGECYRIGGDEFAVIVKEPELTGSEYNEILDGLISQWNYVSSWKLSIARGYCSLLSGRGERISVSDWKLGADVEMYRNKLASSSDVKRDQAKDLKQIIDTIVTTIEAKDVYTAAHSERVSELSVFIGEKLGLTSSTMEKLSTAAYLHDIGKIGVPDFVLNKPGRLTDDEFELMTKHTEIGADILAKASGFKDVANIVRFHHERYDGKGYPRGLEGTDIPLESRIIAITDSIDAMTSKRVYRDSLSVDECRHEIERNAGIMYDPAVVKIVLDYWDGIKDIILLHPKRLIGGGFEHR